MSQSEVLRKLARVFNNQNKILQKLAQMPAPPKDPSKEKPFVDEQYTPSKEDIESDLREAQEALMGERQEMGSFEDEEEVTTSQPSNPELSMKGYDLMHQVANNSFGRPNPVTPEKFEEKIQQYMRQSRDPLFHKTLDQLERLAQRDPLMWGEIGEHFANSGWGPGNIQRLVERLKSNK